MYLAIEYVKRLDIAGMLARKGAECTADEIEELGKKYTDFISSIRTEEQTRRRKTQSNKKMHRESRIKPRLLKKSCHKPTHNSMINPLPYPSRKGNRHSDTSGKRQYYS